MLINTVVLFLTDVLPVAILTGYIACLRIFLRQHWFYLITVALSLVIVLSVGRGTISGWFDGNGYEVISVFLYAVCFFMLLIYSFFAQPQQTITRVAIIILASILVALHFADFSLYFFTFSAYQERLLPISIGALLGFGISASVTIIITVLLTPYRHHWWFPLCIILFVTGHISDATYLLQQIGWLNESGPLWDTSAFIDQQSEYGHLLQALMGYRSSPDAEYVLCWFFVFIFASVTLLVRRKNSSVEVQCHA